jgi:hypothetical protein
MTEADKKSVNKVLPEITLDTIAPPYPGYDFFDKHDKYPFRYTASIFDMQNAWWLIEASILAYSEEAFVGEKFQNADLKDVKFFDGQETGTQLYVASNDNFVIVAFRGTEIRKRPGRTDFRNIVADIATDVDIHLVDSRQGGKVHKGFKDGLDEVWNELRDYLSEMDNGTRTIWFTGHSLGAALATLAADRYGHVQGLYTFGSPRVGDLDFKKDFHIKTYRFVNNSDIVARVPPPVVYCHVGELRYIDAYGQIHDNTSLWERAVDIIDGHTLSVFNGLGQTRHGFAKLIPDSIIDHVPLLYSMYIWNNIL